MTRTKHATTNVRTRTIAYVRVSTDKQAEHGVSLDAQRAKLDAYAALYDLELVAVEVDATSAKDLARPALTRALAELRAGRADALLVVKLDRLTRSVRDLGELVDRCTREGWALLSVGDAVDTRTAAGRLVLNVLASVAQWEREAIGERTAAAMRWKRDAGEYTGGEVRYGYRLAADGRTLEADDAEQAVVSAAVELRAAGLSLRAVGAELAARGLMPRSGGRWHAETVKAVLAVAA
jgi:site-specific DNA recombinase